jgi:hypothetical protein
VTASSLEAVNRARDPHPVVSRRWTGPVRTLASYRRLVSEFDFERNAPLLPAQIARASKRPLWWRCPAGPDHRWRAMPTNRTFQRTGCPFCAGKRPSVTNSLTAVAPKLARQLDRELNGGLDPRQLLAGSGREIWWRCSRGPDHVWRAKIRDRVGSGGRCPFCIGQLVSVTNCLATLRPELAREWDKERNQPLKPGDVTVGSDRKVSWRCPNDRRHFWLGAISHRAGKARTGCPHCAHKSIFSGASLADLKSRIAALWHPTRNGRLTPRDLFPSSGRRVWWKCLNGPDHEWEAAVYAVSNSKGCPFCAHRRVSVTNCLATRFPKVARTWHPTRNGEDTPRDVLATGKKRYWWICATGHEWNAVMESRTILGTGCFVCWAMRRRARVATKGRGSLRVRLPSDYQ